MINNISYRTQANISDDKEIWEALPQQLYRVGDGTDVVVEGATTYSVLQLVGLIAVVVTIVFGNHPKDEDRAEALLYQWTKEILQFVQRYLILL